MSKLESRLSAWFDDEVERARADIEARSAAAPVARGRPRMNAIAAFAIVAVLAILVGGSLAMGHRTQSDETRPSSPAASPVAQLPPAMEQPTVGADLDITGWYWDGVPASIAGENVLRPGAAAVLRGVDLEGLLVGGWTRLGAGSGVLCLNDAPCPTIELGESTSSTTGIGVAAPENIPPLGSPVVMRLKIGASTLVWAADPGVYIADRFDDGIPRHVNDEEVHRVEEIHEAFAGVDPGTSVLVGGWTVTFAKECPPPAVERSDLLVVCDGLELSSTPSPLFSAPGRSIEMLSDIQVPDGPAILRVHDRDTQAVECAKTDRQRCEETIVVDEVIWAGDEYTGTAPRTIVDVVGALHQSGLTWILTAVPPRPADEECHPDDPPMTWQATNGPVGRVLVFATVAERKRVGPIEELGYGGLSSDGNACVVMVDTAIPSGARWIEWDNVLVEVPYLLSEPVHEVDARVEQVRAALGLEDRPRS